MFLECQHLLHLFGLPFLISPMEAEAQCAWLNSLGLVDGVVTDDTDVFLFGAKLVFRHIFQENKFAEKYDMRDVERELGLGREGLVDLALLLGSDYTEGCNGIGIVNALEVVSAWKGVEGLERFREWVEGDCVMDVAAEVAAAAAAAGRRKIGAKAKTTTKNDQHQERGKGSRGKRQHTGIGRGQVKGRGRRSGEEKKRRRAKRRKRKSWARRKRTIKVVREMKERKGKQAIKIKIKTQTKRKAKAKTEKVMMMAEKQRR